MEYGLLIFTSTSSVEGWIKLVDMEIQRDFTGSFVVSSDMITIAFEDQLFVGIIQGTKLTASIKGEKYYFYKQ